jgi:hypothetical protein
MRNCFGVLVIAVAACGPSGMPQLPTTPELLAHTFTVRLKAPCTAARGCSSAPGITAVIVCEAVLDEVHGVGWASCADDFVDAAAAILPDGSAELSFTRRSDALRLTCSGIFSQPNNSPPVLFGGRGAGGPYDGGDATCSAQEWPQ